MGQTYTRQSSFADGDTITAALFNNEYNQLVNAFSYSATNAATTGHRHDGSAGEGGNIPQIGDLDFLNKIVVDSTNNRWGFYVQVSTNTVEQIRLQDGALLPVTDSDVDLGTSSLYFKDAYIDSITTTGNVAVGGNLTVTGTTTFNGGTITMGDAATDNVVFGADVDSNIIPDDDDSYDLGSSSQEWRNLYIDGTANIDSLVADTADINGGTIDGAVIGGSSAAAITGTTITGTAITGTSFVIGSADISEAELEILDGATVTTDELNILDGVTSTTAEINLLDGVTSTTAELNILDGVTSTAAELNILDGVTSTTAELNILDGVTASAADINLIDGITNGTVIASKAIITDANKDITGGRNITITGELDAATLDISGNADIDGTLETDALSINGTTVTSTAAELNLLDGKAFLDEDDMSSNSATGIASQQSIKAYVDTQITAEDLDITTDSGTIAIDLDSETLTVSGGTGLDSSATGNAVTLAIDSTVATLTGTQTLTNKTLTSPDINTPDIDGGTIDAAVIGGVTPAAGTFTTLTANTSITGTLATAAQTNITSLGTLTGLTSSGTVNINNSSGFGNLELGGSSGGYIDFKTPFVDDQDARIFYGGTQLVISTNADQPILLKHNNATVLTTSSTGIDVTGSIASSGNITGTLATAAQPNITSLGTLTSFNVDSTGSSTITSSTAVSLRLKSVDEGTGLAPILDLIRDSASPAANDKIGQIRFRGEDSDSNVQGYATIGCTIIDPTNGSEDSSLLFNTIIDGTSAARLSLKQNEVVINDASIDLDFRVESDGKSNMLFVDGGNDRVGIGTGSPSDLLDVRGDGADTYIRVGSDTAAGNDAARIGKIDSSTDFVIQASLGSTSSNTIFKRNTTAETMRIDSSGNVGIGTTSPAAPLDLAGNFIFKSPANTLYGNFDTTTAGYGAFRLQNQGSNYGYIGQTSSILASGGSNTALGLRSENEFAIATGGSTERLRIDANGNCGIGTSSPSEKLEVSNTSGGASILIKTSASDGGNLLFGDTDSNSIGRVRYDHSANAMQFYANAAERMRIDSSGNLLVGKTSTSIANTGTTFEAGGRFFTTANGKEAAIFNRQTSDGDILEFRKDNTTTVGIIGAKGGDLTIGTGVVGLRFHDATGSIRPITTVDGTVTDDTVDLGTTVARFDDIYATNATIQTSDRNEKQDIEDLTDAETRVAVAAKGLLRKFKWKSAVASKGDNARIHFGIIAQDLQDAFTAEGLDAGDYAMFISNTWTDDDGVEQTRLGVRYSELLAFIIAAI